MRMAKDLGFLLRMQNTCSTSQHLQMVLCVDSKNVDVDGDCGIEALVTIVEIINCFSYHHTLQILFGFIMNVKFTL